MIVYRLEAHPDGESWTVLFFSEKCHAKRAYADACRNTHWDVYLDSQIVPSGRDALVEALNGAHDSRTIVDGLTLIDKRVAGAAFRRKRVGPPDTELETAGGAA